MNSVVEFFSLHNERNEAWDQEPLAAAWIGRPKIPIRVEDVGVVIVNQIGGYDYRFFRSDSGREAAFEDAGFIPGDRLHGGIRDARTLRRERKLLQDREHVRQHRRTGEIGKPEAQI